MKFSCEKCQTRYSIGDEKVAGKVLKIRCKTCGNIMVVRESGARSSQAVDIAGRESAQGGTVQPLVLAQGGGAAKPGPAAVQQLVPPPRTNGEERFAPSSAASTSAQYGAVDWYVAIQGKQHGPVKHQDVVRFFKDGKITERSYCWNDAMSAWTRLRDAPEFKGVVDAHLAAVARGAVPASGLPQTKRAPPPPPEEQGAEIVSLDAARQQKNAREAAERLQHGASVTSSAAPDPFAAVSAPGVTSAGAPRESTRIFIMQAGLHNRASKQKAIALAAGVVVAVVLALLALDYAGLVELPLLHRVVAATTSAPDRPQGVQLAKWDEDDDASAAVKCKLSPAECPQILSAVHEKKAKRRAQVTGAVVAEPVAITRTEGDFAFASDTSEAHKIGAVFQGDVGRTAPRAPTTVIETPQVASTQIDVAGLGRVVKQGQEAIKSCMDQAAKAGERGPGKQILTITLRPNGSVGAAYFKDAAVNAQGVGTCITGVAKRWKFAPFPGEATDVEIPLILSVH